MISFRVLNYVVTIQHANWQDEVIKAINKKVNPKDYDEFQGFKLKIDRIKAARSLSGLFPDTYEWKDRPDKYGIVGLGKAKDFVETHWR